MSEHGYELHGCVEGIQHRFLLEFFVTKLCQCGNVSAPLGDPKGVCDWQNMDMNYMAVWTSGLGSSLFFFQFCLLQSTVSVW